MISSGKKRLRLTEDKECFLFEEEDGTEIEDDDCLLEYEKGTLFLIGTEWTSCSTVACKQAPQDSPKPARSPPPSEKKDWEACSQDSSTVSTGTAGDHDDNSETREPDTDNTENLKEEETEETGNTEKFSVLPGSSVSSPSSYSNQEDLKEDVAGPSSSYQTSRSYYC